MGNLFLGALYIHDETYINTGFFSIQGEIFKGTILLWVEKVDLHLRIGPYLGLFGTLNLATYFYLSTIHSKMSLNSKIGVNIFSTQAPY